MCWTDDPVADFNRYDMEMERKRERHYKGECIHCREAVYDYDDHYDMEGDLLHEDCLYGWAEQYKK